MFQSAKANAYIQYFPPIFLFVTLAVPQFDYLDVFLHVNFRKKTRYTILEDLDPQLTYYIFRFVLAFFF